MILSEIVSALWGICATLIVLFAFKVRMIRRVVRQGDRLAFTLGLSHELLAAVLRLQEALCRQGWEAAVLDQDVQVALCDVETMRMIIEQQRDMAAIQPARRLRDMPPRRSTAGYTAPYDAGST